MIKPLGKKILLEVKEEKMGAIQSESIQEKGVIIAIGPDVLKTMGIKDKLELLGETLYFKAWACDIITDDGKKYYFIAADSEALCGIK